MNRKAQTLEEVAAARDNITAIADARAAASAGPADPLDNAREDVESALHAMRRRPLPPALALAAALLGCGGRGDPSPSPSPEPDIRSGTQLAASVRPSNDINFNIDALTQTSGGIQVDGWAYIDKAGARDSEISLVLQSPDGVQRTFRGWAVARPDVSQHYKNPDLDDSGFSVWIPRSALGPGEYRVGVYIRRQGRDALEFTSQVVRID